MALSTKMEVVGRREAKMVVKTPMARWTLASLYSVKSVVEVCFCGGGRGGVSGLDVVGRFVTGTHFAEQGVEPVYALFHRPPC